MPAGVHMLFFQKHPELVSRLKYILITHSHLDHFLPLVVATLAEQKLKASSEPLELLGNHTVISAMRFYLEHQLVEGRVVSKENKPRIKLTQLEPFKLTKLAPFEILPLPANHAIDYSWESIYPEEVKLPFGGNLLLKREDAFNYLIAFNQQKVFYGLDSAWPLPQTMAVLKEQQLDLAVLDATFGFEDPLPGHMNFEIVAQLVDELCLEDKAIASHLSLHWVPPHSQSEPWLAKRKIKLAYDGMSLSI